MAGIHYVCTRDEARELADNTAEFWIGNCFCREGKEGKCERSRHDVCVWFTVEEAEEGHAPERKATRADIDEIFQIAEDSNLVTRPFRDFATKTRTDGICFCCDDCCGYFHSDNEDESCDAVESDETFICDKGAYIESTDRGTCVSCGACVDTCFFGAREMTNDGLAVDRDKCYGCGLCFEVCPNGAVEMVKR
jgi:ferredoxin